MRGARLDTAMPNPTAADKSDRMGALRVRMRNEKATATIWSYAVMKSLAVALNPGATFPFFVEEP